MLDDKYKDALKVISGLWWFMDSYCALDKDDRDESISVWLAITEKQAYKDSGMPVINLCGEMITDLVKAAKEKE